MNSSIKRYRFEPCKCCGQPVVSLGHKVRLLSGECESCFALDITGKHKRKIRRWLSNWRVQLTQQMKMLADGSTHRVLIQVNETIVEYEDEEDCDNDFEESDFYESEELLGEQDDIPECIEFNVVGEPTRSDLTDMLLDRGLCPGTMIYAVSIEDEARAAFAEIQLLEDLKLEVAAELKRIAAIGTDAIGKSQ